MAEQVLDVENGGSFVQRATDPVVSNVGTPADFAGQFPNPLDPTEVLALCEDISAWNAIPEIRTGLKTFTWREMSSLALTSGSHYIGFADGACPEEYTHDGSNLYVDLKNIGVKKSLTLSDIMHSAASIMAGGAISRLNGPANYGEGLPGNSGQDTFLQTAIADLKEKEVRLGMTLTMNAWDRLLVAGNASSYPLEFDGIESYATNRSCTFHTNSTAASGSFSAVDFDRFLSEGCQKPTHLFGHPAAIQEMMSAYFQLGYQGSQLVNFNSGDRIIPGFNFGGYVNTGIGRLAVVADANFTRSTNGTNGFISKIFALRMTHNGDPLVHKITQIPLSMVDLAPGCTSVAFEIWAKTALVIKSCCAQGAFTGFFTGRTTATGCTLLG